MFSPVSMRRIRTAATALALAASAALGGCVSPGSSMLPGVFGGNAAPAAAPAPAADPKLVRYYQTGDTFCPQVILRDGTDVLPVTAGNGDVLKFQGAIARYTRECTSEPGAIRIKVGVAGRLITGPQGGSGAADLPVRITLEKNGKDILYSKITVAHATITEPEDSTFWSVVDDGITLPGSVNQNDYYAIYTGFDIKPPKPAKPVAAKPHVRHAAAHPHVRKQVQADECYGVGCPPKKAK